jgi:cytoskeletal protein CcmA (bactofilin family)
MGVFNAKGDRIGSPEAVTLVGEEAYFHGVLAAKGSLRVEGAVEGDITDAVSVEIGKKGKVKGNIAAESVSVAGVVEGDIVCSRAVEVLAGGRLAGNIRTPSLRIEEGALFDGSCAMVAADETVPRGSTDDQSYQSVDKR